MTGLVERVFDRFGTPARLVAGEVEKAVSVLLQSSRQRSAERVFVPLGEVLQGRQVCLLPASSGALAGDSLLVRGESWQICRVEQRYWGTRVLYLWALCREQEGL